VSVTLHEPTKLDGLLSDLLGVPNSKISGITFGASKARQRWWLDRHVQLKRFDGWLSCLDVL